MFAMKSMNILNDQFPYDEIIIFLFTGYFRRTLNSLERITLSDLIHMMNMVDHVTISIETPRIDSGCSLEKEFIELIPTNT